MNAPPFPPRPLRAIRSLRLVFLLPVVMLILAAGWGAASLSFNNARDATATLSASLHDQIAQRTAERIDAFLSPAPQLLRENAILAATGILPMGDLARLRQFFASAIHVHRELNSHYLAFAGGGMVGAGMDGEQLYVTGTPGTQPGQWRKAWANAQGEPGRVITALPNFDARLRPWFKKAAEQADDQVVWSGAYVLFSGQDMALTASRVIRDAQSHISAVIAADVFLSKISDFLRQLHRQQPGLTFIIDEDGLLVATSTGDNPFVAATPTRPAHRLAARDSANPAIAQAAQGLALSTDTHFSIGDGDLRQTVTVVPFTEPHGLSWQILVVVPESAYLDPIRAGNHRTALLVVAVVVAATLLGLALVYWVSRAIGQIRDGAQALSLGHLEHRVAIPVLTELADLAQAFNRMADAQTQADQIQKRHIAEISAAENLLRDKNKALETSNAELEYFAYVASHDLREPLRNVTAYSTLLGKRLQGRLSDEEQEFLHFIHQGGLRMDGLVRDLLDFARVGRHGDPMTALDMEESVFMATNNLRLQIAECNATVSAKPPLPRLKGWSRELTSLLQNLIANALKYRRPDHPPEITLSCQREGAFWHFQLSDNGIGLAQGQGYEERIFKLFQRLHQQEQFGGGTGVGLALCKRVVEHHGGQIWVHSDGTDQGCTFHFTLPAAEGLG